MLRALVHIPGRMVGDTRPAARVERGAEFTAPDPGHLVEIGYAEYVEDDLDSLTKAELYEVAQERDLSGRSTMSRDELYEALK